MLRKQFLIAGACLAVIAAEAGELRREVLPADTKWVLHLDVDSLRNSKVGGWLMDERIMGQAEKVKKSANFDLPAVLKATHSITAYGASYESEKDGKGVLLWHGEPEIEQIATAFLIQQAEATKAGEGNVKREQEKPYSIYSMDDKVRAAILSGQGLILGRDTGEIREAAAVLRGDSKSLVGAKSFAGYPVLPKGAYFLTAHADSLGQQADIPPQAEVLKLTDGGRFAIGEVGENLKIQLILRARDEDVTQQIQQVAQGLLALATLSLGEEPELQSILRATKVVVDGRLVMVDLVVPLEKALEQMDKQNEDDASE